MASCPGGRWCPGALSGPGDEDVIEVGSEEPDPTVPRGAECVESRGGDPPCRLHLQEAAPPTIDGSQAGRGHLGSRHYSCLFLLCPCVVGGSHISHC